MKQKEKTSQGSASEDAELIKAFQAGKKAAFDELVLSHKDKVFNLCYWFVGDYQDANDLAQDVFFKAFKALKNFRFESAFSTWIYRIAVNTCKNRLKSFQYRLKKKFVHLNNTAAAKNNPGVEIADESSSPEIELGRKEKSRLIQTAINSLPTEKKAVVVLRDIEGLSYEEISSVTGFNLGTVKSKLARARQDLREKLKGEV
ncbi:MAG: sigma-70 family RNA polymerase sigma factor [Desulfobacterales bacterium]|nr:sigma-70 family RNA polymerase sigma factor [Desulfobacterales bacterium]MDX2509755.1 sigma-70 family RNA polymerase sigma factor [Desulfobacterales bacterium]